MALTPSTMIPLGTKAPDFELLNPSTGHKESLKKLSSSQATVLMFICNHCPYVKHIQMELVKLTKEYSAKGVAFIAINSNDIATYPEDSPEHMVKVAQQYGYPFPYLFDETQEVAKAYHAACTPDFFLFDGHFKCVYRGQFDDSRPGNQLPVTGQDLRKALDQLLAGQSVFSDQKPSSGCNIKWK